MRDNENFLGNDVCRPYYILDKNGQKVYSYIDVVCSNFDIGNECQIAVYCDEQAAGLVAYPTIEEIEKIFWSRFIKEGLAFINYHYLFNKNANKTDFFYWMESSFVAFKKDIEYWNTLIDSESFAVSEKYLKEWIEEKKQSIEVVEQEGKIPMAAIALMYQILRVVGEHEGINAKNRDEIAKEHGFTSESSGRKLDNYYKKFLTEDERTRPFFSDNSEKTSYERSKAAREELFKIIIHQFEIMGCKAALERANTELAQLKKMKAQ